MRRIGSRLIVASIALGISAAGLCAQPLGYYDAPYPYPRYVPPPAYYQPPPPAYAPPQYFGRLLSGTTHAPPTNTAHRWQAVTDPKPTPSFRHRGRAVVAAIATGMDNTAPMPATSNRM
jgi:hypothetical protein